MNLTDAYYATVYFVDPAIICNGGRTEEEFSVQGTGDRLSLQNGPTSADLIHVPLNESEVASDVHILFFTAFRVTYMYSCRSFAGILGQTPVSLRHGPTLLQHATDLCSDLRLQRDRTLRDHLQGGRVSQRLRLPLHRRS